MTDKKFLQHKTYCGSIDISLEDGCLYGKVLFIRDTIIYEGDTLPELIASFESAVDQYLESCKALGREPNKTYSGGLNVRITPELHRSLACLSFKRDESINKLINEAVGEFVTAHEQEEENKWQTTLGQFENSAPTESGPVMLQLIEGGRN